MPVEWIKTLVVNDVFSKWYIQPTGEYTMLSSFSPYCRNIRLNNQNTIVRPWFRTVAKDETIVSKSIKWITSNENLYVALNSKLKSVDLTTGVYTDIGTLAGDYDYNFVNYGKYTICCDGVGYPYLYDGTTFSQYTSSNIDVTALPRFWDAFLNGVYLAWGGTNKNTLYLSRGVTYANPQYANDFIWTGSEKVYMKSNIVSLCATLNRLFIFTERDWIRYISKETTVSAWWLTATDTLPISGSSGNIPASHRAVVKADELVFFFTTTKQIKSLNYVQGITEVQVGNISERASQSIRDFMDTLDDDQSNCFGYFNWDTRTVHWHVKEKGMPFNNKVIVYDIINDTFLIDDNKFMSCATVHNSKYYTWSSINSYLFQDEVWFDDDWMEINRVRQTKNMNFWNQNLRKVFRGVGIVWQISPLWQIRVEVVIDWQSEHVSYINWPWLPSAWLWAVPQWSFPVWWEHYVSTLQSFQKYLSKWDIRVKWYVMKVIFSGSCKGDQIVLSSMSIDTVNNNTIELSDKI